MFESRNLLLTLHTSHYVPAPAISDLHPGKPLLRMRLLWRYEYAKPIRCALRVGRLQLEPKGAARHHHIIDNVPWYRRPPPLVSVLVLRAGAANSRSWLRCVRNLVIAIATTTTASDSSSAFYRFSLPDTRHERRHPASLRSARTLNLLF